MSEKAKVYFSKEISPEKVLEMYQLLGKKLDGKVAIKLHSGEVGNQNFLKPEFWKPVIDYVGGTVVECNTAYEICTLVAISIESSVYSQCVSCNSHLAITCV